jgi:2-oxoglutarate dehydrogenase E2 component (dihydrolipoamide succinyltransferase)
MPAPRDHVAFWAASAVLVAAAVTAYVALLGPAPRPPPARPAPAVAAPAPGAPGPGAAEPPRPPALEVSWPAETTTRERRLVVRGRAAPGSSVAVRGERARVAADGTFLHVIFLQEGEQRVTVAARDRQGRRTEVVSPAIVLDTGRQGTEARAPRDGPPPAARAAASPASPPSPAIAQPVPATPPPEPDPASAPAPAPQREAAPAEAAPAEPAPALAAPAPVEPGPPASSPAAVDPEAIGPQAAPAAASTADLGVQGAGGDAGK